MRRIFALLLVFGLVFGLVACAAEETPEPETTTTITTTEPTTTIGPLVRLYLPSPDGTQAFITMDVETDGTPQYIVQLLMEHGALPQGSELLQLEQTWAANDNYSTADMNQAFLVGLLQLGSHGELMVIASLVNSLLGYSGPGNLANVTITVEGQTLETGHEIYDYPLEYFDFS